MRPQKMFAMLMVCLFSVVAASAQLTAGFTASPTSGCAPLLVNFTNTTSGGAGTTYAWTFGSTGSSVLTNPSTSFTSPGTYNVTLTATSGGVTSTYSTTITVFPPPTVNFTASSTTVCPGAPVTFTSTTTSGVPGPVTYSWVFGDGGPTVAGNPVSHVYTAAGDYTLTLFATNASGCTASLVRTAYIHVVNKPNANFTWDPLGLCNPPGVITFTNTSTGSGAMSCAWTFGDGGTGSGSPAPHTYTAIGAYSVHLIVTDATGCSDTAILGPVRVDTIHAAFTLPESACVSTTVSFINTSSTHTSQTWNYGDGSPLGTALNGSHSYSSPGTYTVTLTIVNGPCTATVTHTITILPGPIADFTMIPTQPCPAPVTITYTGTGPAGTIYNWIAGSGGLATGSPVTYTYTTNGVKTMKMIVIDPVTGCRDTVAKADTIYDLDFRAHASPIEGCVPLVVDFSTDAFTHVPSGTAAYPYPMTSYSWNFGDGSAPGTGGTPSHTYTATGIYTATVTGTTANGCTATATVTIKVGAPPVVTFTATPRHICYSSHTPVVFTPVIVTGPVDEFHWDFGDGGTTIVYGSTAIPTSHAYTVPGIFTVVVTPYYLGCPGIPYSITDYITIDPPKAIIVDTIQCSPATRVTFYDVSIGDDSHLWLFGDGTTSTASSTFHDYPSTGTYTVTLATYNTASGCRDTATKIINLTNPVPSFVANDTTICRNESVTFTSTVSGGTATNYYWYVNWVLMGGSTPTFTHLFTTTGYFTISLVIRNANGCLDTVTRNNYIFVSGPTAAFTGGPASGCRPLSVLLNDASTTLPGTSIVSYVWDMGDAYGTTGSVVAHTYTATGTFNVMLTVTDNNGCTNTFTAPGYVHVYHPTASFTVSNTHPCMNLPVTFTSTSAGAGGISSVEWDFGDGSLPGTGTSVAHTYTALGTYDVKLTVTDTHGCTDEVIYPAYINITRPVANFTMSDSVSVCPPLSVHFTNTSTGAVSYHWDLGDGTTTAVTSPSDMYIAPALYTVVLIATNSNGCTDTMRRFVNIFGYAGAFSYTPLTGCAPFAVHFTATLSNVPFITWDFSDGTTSTMAYTDTITHIYATPGGYVPKLLLSDNTGCQNSSLGLDTIKVDAVTAKFGTAPNPVCIGVPFSFKDSSTTYWAPVTAWAWTYDGNTSSIASPTYTINTPGTYHVTLHVTNAWGCEGITDHDIVVLPPPVVTASPDTVVCIGDAATLVGYGALTYSWAPPATISCPGCNPAHATPLAETIYTVTGTDANGCIDTAAVTVRLRTNTVSHAWGDTAVCMGVSVQIFDTGGTAYLWLPDTGLDNNLVYNPTASPQHTQTYTVIAKLAGCLPDTNYVTVTIYPLPTVDAGPDQRLLAGSSAQLNATGTGITTYAWSPEETLSCTDCFNPVASMSVMTTYNVDVYSEHGCKASDSVRVMLYCDNSQLFVPNAFTPNGDGQNDVFYPRGIGVKIIKTFRIYNRWGELLFDKNNIALNDVANAWDGSYKGASPKPDVYVYIIEAVCYTGDDINIKGDVTVIR